MARHTNKQVAHLFAHHQAGNSNNMHSDGTTLESYSTVIAVWHDGVCFISSDGMSITTNGKHLSPLHSAIYRQPHFYSPAFYWGRYGAPSAAECILSAAEEMQESFNELCRKRVYVTESIERYETRRAEIISMAARFDVANLPDMPEATGDLKEKAKELAKIEAKKRAEQKQREEERERAQRIIDQGELDLWLQQGRGRYPYSFRTRGADQITIRAEHQNKHLAGKATTVITSQGAEAPLDHVIKALKFYDSRKQGVCKKCAKVSTYNKTNSACCGADMLQQFDINRPGTPFMYAPYHTNGHKIHLGAFVLDSIDEAGNVKAGCHTFTAAEIARFRKQWGL